MILFKSDFPFPQCRQNKIVELARQHGEVTSLYYVMRITAGFTPAIFICRGKLLLQKSSFGYFLLLSLDAFVNPVNCFSKNIDVCG